MSDPRIPWEARLVIEGLRVLAAATFVAFMGWALWHLYAMFV